LARDPSVAAVEQDYAQGQLHARHEQRMFGVVLRPTHRFGLLQRRNGAPGIAPVQQNTGAAQLQPRLCRVAAEAGTGSLRGVMPGANSGSIGVPR
jgi:hypothetical protein